MATIQEFISAHGVKMTARQTDRNPAMATDEAWHRAATHWRCTILCDRRRITITFSTGSGNNGRAPELANVLDCLASDAAGVENARNFEAWAAEYGYDTDSRNAEKTFRACKALRDKMRRLFGPETLESLLFNAEME